MKSSLSAIIFFITTITCSAQNDTIAGGATARLIADIVKSSMDTASFLSKSGGEACSCIDSMALSNKDTKEIAKEMSDCIDKQVDGYQLAVQLFRSMTTGKDVQLRLTQKGSKEYTEYYRRIERWLIDSCKRARDIVATSNKESDKSFSSSENSLAAYTRGVEQMKRENFREAKDYFKTAVALDEQFAFAWDNLGLCERKLGNYDEALAAYNKSLSIDPKGHMPLQNIAIVYEYKKDYDKALEAYRNLLKHFPDDPEAWYGEGRIYTFFKIDLEKGLDAMCKAYVIYDQTGSPYRVDAEKNIQYIYSEMKEKGKEKEFTKILKQNNISRD